MLLYQNIVKKYLLRNVMCNIVFASPVEFGLM